MGCSIGPDLGKIRGVVSEENGDGLKVYPSGGLRSDQHLEAESTCRSRRATPRVPVIQKKDV